MYVIWRHLFVATSRHKSTDTAGKQREEFTVPELSDIVRYYTPLLRKNTDIDWGKRWRTWLRHCATSRKVAGSIPDGVIAIFHWFWHTDRSVALGSTQCLTEMNNRDISWWVKAAGVYGWQPYPFHGPIVLKSWEIQPPGALRVSPGLLCDSFTIRKKGYNPSNRRKISEVLGRCWQKRHNFVQHISAWEVQRSSDIQQNSTHFIKPKCSLPCSKQPTWIYFEEKI
jgi:hypothetical protein